MRKVTSTILLVLLATSPAAGQEWARSMFSESSHDFGTVARSAKAEYAFVLENLYLEDVHIQSVRSSCGCTTPKIEKEWLKTYEKGAIVCALNSSSFLGARSAVVTVTIDKPFLAQVQLHVRAHIRGDLEIKPGSVELGSVDEGQTVDREIEVAHSGRSDWKIVEVKSPLAHVSAELGEPQRRQGQVVYKVKVHLKGDAPAGYVNDHLVLVTNDQREPQIPVLLEGRVSSGFSVSPASLFMGVLQPGEKVTKRLVVRGKKPFTIVSIDCDGCSFEFDTSDKTAKTVHLIPVTFVAGPNAGKIVRKIQIRTDLGEKVPELAAYAVVSKP